MKKIEHKKRKGFTLIEVMVSMFIFALVISASSDFFVRFIKAKNQARDIQENLGNVQYAMNLMTKTFRTSTVVSDPAIVTAIRVYDYSQEKCISYKFDNNSIKYDFKDVTTIPSATNKEECSNLSDADFSNYINLVADIVSNFNMDIIPSSTSPDKVAGRITIFVETLQGSNNVKIQSTVSLRDYVEAGI